ncbi:MAG: DNA polymerase III subunit alpha [Cyclobacteriaceae bacterium]|nr:DNA polymerase III subunit alpha [Cyclobacteriaceae bacterium]
MFLNCHTWYSFKYGTLSADKFFDECKRNNVHKVIITEINNTASYIELLRIIDERKSEFELSIALGIEFRENHALQFIAIAKNNTGFENINRYLSRLNNDSMTIPSRAPVIEETFIVYPFGKIEPNVLRRNEFIGVRTSQVSKYMLRPDYQGYKERFVALQPVTFASKQEWNLHRLLRCIDLNILLSKLQSTQHAPDDEIMVSSGELEKKYRQFPELVQNANMILNACSIAFELGVDKNLKSLTGGPESDWEILVTNAWEGFYRIYDSSDPVLRERFERELSIIQLKDFGTYFLIAYDLIKFTKEKGYDTIGRGSGANSMVAYCLGITNVDPIELDLYFERFLNAERTTPPDFDIDFSWDQRDFIFDYLFNKYGQEHTCLLGAHVTYQGRNTLRELGKVFGLPKEELDELSDHPECVKGRDHITTLIFKYAERMYEMPASMTIHACGVLITEKPIYAYTATFLPPKNYPVSNFEMHSAEDIGIYKFDILSQRGLGHIKETARLVRLNQNKIIDVHDFPSFKKDEKVKELLKSSRCMGCFYVESPAMRSLLGKLKCEDYLTLVAASSIIRPGVSSSGMMKAYIERFHISRNGGTYESIHPRMDELMKETYGVMVYQEDVIRVAHHFAGLTLTEADVLRRAMSGKYRSRKAFEMIERKFYQNCHDFGYPRHVAERVWFEIQSFGGYSFAKGHSASFAVESYQSLYLKAHFPLEFMVAVINNFGGFYTHEFYFHELRMSGGKIQAPCINNSDLLTNIKGDVVHIGLDHLKSLENKSVDAILTERRRSGAFTGMINFLKRVDIGLEQLRILIRIGGFRFTGKTKQELMWQAIFYFSEMKVKKSHTQDLFDYQFTEQVLPKLHRDDVQDAFDEIELLGFPLCDPFQLLGSNEKEDILSKDMMNNLKKQVTMIGYYVTAKYTQTKHKQVMYFGTFYDRDGIVFDTVNFPDVARQYPFRGRGFYLLKGKVVEDFGVPALEVTAMEKLSLVHRQVNLPPAERTYTPNISLSAQVEEFQ